MSFTTILKNSVLIALLFSLLPISLEAHSFIGNLKQEKLVKEGSRQLADLIRYNYQNEKEGHPEDNVYLFSMLNGEDWVEYIKVSLTDPDFASSVEGQLNERLKQFNNNPANGDKRIYVCLVSKMPVKVAYPISSGKTFDEVAADYRAYESLAQNGDGNASANNIIQLQSDYKDLLRRIYGRAHAQLVDSEEYDEFFSKSDRVLISQTLIQNVLFSEQGDKLSKTFALFGGRHHGYFQQHKAAIRDYERSMLGQRSASNHKILVNKVFSYIEFAESGMEDPASMQLEFQATGPSNLAEEVDSAEDNIYEEEEVYDTQDPQYIFDFTGFLGYKDALLEDELNNLLSGRLRNSDTKLKVVITDQSTEASQLAIIENIDMTHSALSNTIVLWAHVDENKVEASIRIAPDLQAEINTHLNWERLNRLVQISFDPEAAAATNQAIFKFFANIIYTSAEFVSSVIKKGRIPAKYYRVDTVGYDRTFKNVFSFILPVGVFADLIAAELYQLFPDLNILSGEEEQPSDLSFALFCGLWNGVLEEMSGIVDLFAMVGYWVDDKKKAEIDGLVEKIKEDGFWVTVGEMIVEIHSGPPCKVAHQIGKDAIMMVSIFVPFSNASSLSQLRKVVGLMDNLNPLTHLFTGAGYVLRKAAGKTIDVFNNLSQRIAYIQNQTLIALEQHLWIPLEEAVIATQSLLYPKVAVQSTNGQITFQPLMRMEVDNPSGGENVKKLGQVSDDLLNLAGDLKRIYGLESLFPEERVDEIAEKVAQLQDVGRLTSTEPLDIPLQNEIIALDDNIKRQFFIDLANDGPATVNTTSPSWIGKNLGTIGKEHIIVFKSIKNSLLRVNYDALVLGDKMLNDGFTPSHLKNIASDARHDIRGFQIADKLGTKTTKELAQGITRKSFRGDVDTQIEMIANSTSGGIYTGPVFDQAGNLIDPWQQIKRTVNLISTGSINSHSLERGAIEVSQGKLVQIENKNADLEIFSPVKESYQMKRLTTDTESQVISQILKADGQLAGNVNPPEIPTTGHIKIIEIDIKGQQNPLYNQAEEQLLQTLQSMNLTFSAAQKLVIQNNKDRFTFLVTDL